MHVFFSSDCVLWYISVTAQLPGANGYTGGKVILIDTENTLYVSLECCVTRHTPRVHPPKIQADEFWFSLLFQPERFSRPARLRDIADRFNLDQEAVLDNVLYARAYTSEMSLNFVALFTRNAGLNW